MHIKTDTLGTLPRLTIQSPNHIPAHLTHVDDGSATLTYWAGTFEIAERWTKNNRAGSRKATIALDNEAIEALRNFLAEL